MHLLRTAILVVSLSSTNCQQYGQMYDPRFGGLQRNNMASFPMAQYYQNFHSQISPPKENNIYELEEAVIEVDTVTTPSTTTDTMPLIKTMAIEASLYWKANDCDFPPQEFIDSYRESCSEEFKESSIFSGLCRTFFNSSQEICSLSGSTDDEKETMLNIAELQAQVTNDDICDTLIELKQSYPHLFPEPIGEYKWFSHTNNLLFRNGSCHSICGMGNLHPICFGILLNYDFINNKLLAEELRKELYTVDEETLDDVFFLDDSLKDILEGEGLLDEGEEDDEFEFTLESLELQIGDDENISPTAEQLEKYYEYKVSNMDDEENTNKVFDVDDIFFGISSMDINPKFMNRIIDDDEFYDAGKKGSEDNLPFIEQYQDFEITWKEFPYDVDDEMGDDRSLMGTVFAFSCLLAVVMVIYLFKMRHRIFGRSNKSSRPSRWNYKKLSSDNTY